MKTRGLSCCQSQSCAPAQLWSLLLPPLLALLAGTGSRKQEPAPSQLGFNTFLQQLRAPKPLLCNHSFLWNFIVQSFPGTGSGTALWALQHSSKQELPQAGSRAVGRQSRQMVTRKGRRRRICEGAAPYSSPAAMSALTEAGCDELQGLRAGEKREQGCGKGGQAQRRGHGSTDWNEN